jgi:hypothetical protein
LVAQPVPSGATIVLTHRVFGRLSELVLKQKNDLLWMLLYRKK